MPWDEVVQAIDHYIREREMGAVARLAPPTGRDLLEAWGLGDKHGFRANCLECGEDCGTVALVELVRTFEVCACEEIPYTHLAEQLHHRSCFLAGAAK